MNRDWRRLAFLAGFGLIVPGGLMALALCIILPLAMMGDSYSIQNGLITWLALVALGLGGGLALVIHARNSQLQRPSRPLKLPPLWGMLWGLLLVLVAGSFLNGTDLGALLFPPIFILAGALPPLAALTWAQQDSPSSITLRQFITAFVLGATAAVGLAIVLEILLPTIFFLLARGLFETLRQPLERLLDALASGEVARELTSYTFIFALIEMALVAPLAEEFAKPLFILPIIRQVENPLKAFLVGAAAGAGFAALENLLYTGFGMYQWGAVLVLRILGAGIHPLCSGLVALGWYFIINVHLPPGPHPVSRRLPLVGAALAIHATWNGGTLFLLTLANAHFFGSAPAEVDILGYTMAGVLLALLAVLGLGVLLGLRAAVQKLAHPAGTPEMDEQPIPLLPTAAPTDRQLALWGLLCLIIALPLGLAALAVLRGLP